MAMAMEGSLGLLFFARIAYSIGTAFIALYILKLSPHENPNLFILLLFILLTATFESANSN